MNYNHFTVSYIEAIQSNLKIEVVNEQALFYPDYILPEDIENLKQDLRAIWSYSNTSIEVIKNRTDSKIQSGLFGLVNNFDLAIRTGFLLGDRIILIDYLYDRLLKNKDFERINIEQIGSISANLVSLLELAKMGRIVIIPSPFNWNLDTKKIIEEASINTILTPEMMSLLNLLSITKLCKLHPYTISESEENYNSIIHNQINLTEELDRNSGLYAYQGILGALLSEKLFKETEFQTARNISLINFYKIIETNENFYSEFLKRILDGGVIDGEHNIDKLRDEFAQNIRNKNKTSLISNLKSFGAVGGIGSGLISLVGTGSLISPTLGTIGALLGLSSTLTGLLKNKNENSVISIFKKLNKN